MLVRQAMTGERRKERSLCTDQRIDKQDEEGEGIGGHHTDLKSPGRVACTKIIGPDPAKLDK